MPDDLSKRGEPDKSLLNRSQKHEVDYFIKQLQKEIPGASKQDIEDALESVPTNIRKRETIKDLIKKKLKK